MKRIPLLYMAVIAFLFLTCKKEAVKVAPVINTKPITNVTSSTFTTGGDVTSDGGVPVTARGVCWSLSENPTVDGSKTSNGTGTGTFSCTIPNLTPGETYYIRAYATNSIGTSYGNQLTSSTLAALPSIVTIIITDTTTNSAASGGNVTSDGGAPILYRGVCWSTSQNPTTQNFKTTNGTGSGVFSSSLTNLEPSMTYYVRAYATNEAGTAYGSQYSFETKPLTVTDVDGNLYSSVRIGNQIWMVENLRTTKFRNGVSIPNVMNSTDWKNDTTAAYANQNNYAGYANPYGRLYNWYAVTDSRGLAPAGWHIPSEAEWNTMINYIGGNTVAGGKLKEAGNSHWNNPNTGATNQYGFAALPGGQRTSDGLFSNFLFYGFYWTSSPNGAQMAFNKIFQNDQASVTNGSFYKNCGYSVRCVKD